MQQAELRRMTVIEYSPNHPQADVYRELAKKIENNTKLTIPTPLAMDDLEQLLLDFGLMDDDESIVGLTEEQEKLKAVAS